MLRTLDDEARTPKYAQIERERRWLVDPAQRPDVGDLPHVLIEDRYIADSRLRLRRMTDSLTGQTALKLTRKYECADVRARPIVTVYLSPVEYALLAVLPAATLTKRRLAVGSADATFSLDQFSGPLTGLELLEKECPDSAGLLALLAPDWALVEVTDDTFYTGAMLARAGMPER